MMDRMMRNFHAAFAAPLTEDEQLRREYVACLAARENSPNAPTMSFDEWKKWRAANGNQEGQNHD